MDLDDIKKDLDEKVDSFKDLKLKKIEVNNISEKNTSDIKKNLKKINLIKNKFIKILENSTKNFDGIIIKSKLKDIDLNKKSTFPLFFNKNPFNKNYFSIKNIIRPYFLKKIGLLFLIFITFLFFDKILVEYTINSGYKKIISLKESNDINEAQLKVNNAKFDFIIGSFLYKPFLLIPNENIKTGYNIIEGGKSLTSLLDSLLQTYVNFIDFTDNKGLNNVLISNVLYNLKQDFIKTETKLGNTLYLYNKIKNINNNKIKDKFLLGVNYLKLFKEKLSIINQDYDNFLNVLGHDSKKTYLVLFQNNDEIRATGGFMGSVGIIEVFKGRVINIETKDIYSIEWDLKKVNYKKLKAPKGIDKLTTYFGLRDSNYYANIEKSSNSIRYFIEKAGINIDGILYLNKNIILDFLKVTGDINMKDIGENITSENFSRMISLLVEAKIFKKGTLGTPKQILFDFITYFRTKLLSDKDYINYAKVVLKNIISRDIIFYSFNVAENKLLSELGLNGDINFNKTLDFSYVVYTSISGNKSGRYMKRTYTKKIKKLDNCSIKTNLQIKSKHKYNTIEENKLKKIITKYAIKNEQATLYIQGAGENRQYVRVLLPKGAIVEKSNKYKIYKTQNFTMLDFFLKTRKGEITFFNINYKIENKTCRKYNYIFYKQPGIKSYNFRIENTKKDIIQKNGIEKDFTYNVYK